MRGILWQWLQGEDGRARSAVGVAVDTDELRGSNAPPQGGSFRFYLDGQRWEWSDPVARMHGYHPGEITPTTELLLSHKHPDDQPQVAALFDKMIDGGEPFSSKHRIIDTERRIHHVIVVGDRMLDKNNQVVGTSGITSTSPKPWKPTSVSSTRRSPRPSPNSNNRGR